MIIVEVKKSTVWLFAPVLTIETTGVKAKLAQALSAYLAHCSDLPLQLRSRLSNMQKDFRLYEEPAGIEDSVMDGVNLKALQFEASVMDEPIINSKAGLYVYLNSIVRVIFHSNFSPVAMLTGSSLSDDL